MHLHWERSNNSAGDCSINALSWMGKVPEEIPEEDGWKLSRTNYYQEGWLATANVRGVVGVTYTTSFCAGTQTGDTPGRTNYNLRGHRSEVTMVKWNEPYQKLASCDSTGIIFVWIKYEGRWSIELINDRSTPVTSFCWSHDGRMALICYQDGFVLVGSVAGQRYWSTMLPSEATVTCGAWTPDDLQVYVATAQGGLIVMDLHGNIVSKVTFAPDTAITDLQWNCEKFNMEERDSDLAAASEPRQQPAPSSASASRLCVLAICFRNGDIKLVTSYDDVSPVLIRTGFQTMQAEWSNSGELLAVAGRVSTGDSGQHLNRVAFYSELGCPLASFVIPYFKCAVTALTWGHNDKRLFVATGTQVHIGWISKKIPSLQLLARLKIHKTLAEVEAVDSLPLPCRLRSLISSLFTHSIKCHVPDKKNLKKFVSRPPTNGLRLYCTMIRHGDEATGSNYTIYLEHLGGFLPILKGKKTSKLKPEFVIFDPLKDIENTFQKPLLNGILNGSLDATSDTELTDQEDAAASSFYTPRLRRRNRRPRRRRNQPHYFGYIGNEEVDYLNTLPEEGRMVEIRSNIWGTKFKIHGVDLSLPPLLGQISYKASLLHLQPRQMRLIVTELRDDMALSYNNNNNNNNSCSEDEDETDKLTMEDEVLTAVTRPQQQAASVAPLPTRLSTADFQRLPDRPPDTSAELSWPAPAPAPPLPQVEVTEVADTAAVNPAFEADFSGSGARLRRLGGCVAGLGHGVRGEVVLPATTVEFDQAQGKWCLKNLTGSKSFDHQLEPSVIDNPGGGAGVWRGRGRVRRRDSVGASTSSAASSPSSSLTSPRRWAAKAEELAEPSEPSIHPAAAPASGTGNRTPCPRSCSADHLGAIVDILGVPAGAPQFWENPRRLILSAEKKKIEMKRNLANLGKSRSLDTEEAECSALTSCPHPAEASCRTCAGDSARDLELNKEMFDVSSPPEEEADSRPLLPDAPLTPRTRRRFDSVRQLLERARAKLRNIPRARSGSRARGSQTSGGSREASEPGSPVHLPRSRLVVAEQGPVSRSSPNTPLLARRLGHKPRNQSFSPVRTLLNSPLLRRKKSLLDSSEEDISEAERPRHPAPGYQNLETFQKQKLRQKLRKLSTLDGEGGEARDRGRLVASPDCSPRVSRRRAKEFVMHNKAPLWNEGSQVYQLDFGGRVTQESAKNFQIEHLGKQVMQFGRIDENAYTLDFQYPLTALQAFSVALANVTQRLK